MLKSLFASALLLGGLAFAPGSPVLAQSNPLASIGQSLQPSSQQLPSEAVQVRLVNETIDIFIEAVKARSMRALYEHASENVKREFTTERLDEVFAQFFKIAITGKPLAGLSPIFARPAEPIGASAFKIVGHYPTRPNNVTFEITYLREGTQWKWVAINVRTAPPGQSGS